MRFDDVLRLEPHGNDVYVGSGPSYPWGGLYGGQIVAQALVAAALTVDAPLQPHSLRAYFIRLGNAAEPIRFEVDRIRNGRSFCTRRVVARQAVGAILNLEASFHAGEESASIQLASPGADVPGIEDPSLTDESWSAMFERRWRPGSGPAGRSHGWFRMRDALDGPLAHVAALAYLSDDLPTEAVVRALTGGANTWSDGGEQFFSASLDHSMWFHRPLEADVWHLHDFTCHTFTGNRGLATGHIFTPGGVHVATVAQEVLVRPPRS